MTKIQKVTFLILFSIFYFLFSSPPASAASLFFEKNNQTFSKGDVFSVDVFLDTQNESINAIEGSLVFPDNLLSVSQIQDGNSAINFWVQKPALVKSNIIDFSGIIPGGYNEKKSFIFSVIFKTNNIGSGNINFENEKILLNDGKGTLTKVTPNSFNFVILPQGMATPLAVAVKNDLIPPEDFKPEIAYSSDLFGGKWFLVFATQDKGSGIDHYEVGEGTTNRFVVAESPYVLQNQKLDQIIFVKAVDKSGNERLEIFYPPNWRPWYKNYGMFGIIILGLLLSGFTVIMLWKKYKK